MCAGKIHGEEETEKLIKTHTNNFICFSGLSCEIRFSYLKVPDARIAVHFEAPCVCVGFCVALGHKLPERDNGLLKGY